MSRNIYPDRVRVFYTNLQIVGDNLCTHVKGIDMEITPKVWSAVAGLKYVGLRINKGNIGVVDKFNKMQFYRSCLKNPQSKVRNFSVGGLKLNERIMAFIVLDTDRYQVREDFTNGGRVHPPKHLKFFLIVF